MGNKKNIDRLFQEQFKDFHQAPNNRVWERIRKSLEATKSKKNKRILPIWLQLSGVAATILLLISIGFSQFTTTHTAPTIVNTQNPTLNNSDNVTVPNVDTIALKNTIKNPIEENLETEKQNLENKNWETTATTSNNNETIAYQKEEIKNTQITTDINRNSTITSQQTITSTTNKERENKVDNRKPEISDINNQNSIISESRNNLSTNKSQNQLATNALKDINIQQKNTPTTVNNTQKHINKNDEVMSEILSKENEFLTKNNIKKTNSELKNNNVILAQNSEKVNTNKKGLTNNTNTKSSSSELNSNNITAAPNTEKTNTIEKETEVEVEKEDIHNAIVTQDQNTIKEVIEDEIEAEKESITEAIAVQKDENIEGNSEALEEIQRWNIATNVAPVYYNSLSSGSPIDNQFSGNKKKGELNTSYGINVSYTINKRLSIRTGVHKLELGYDTQDVAVIPVITNSSGVGSLELKGVNSPSGVNLNISSANSFSVSQIPSGFSTLFDSSLNQRFGYIEVPLEIGYKISTKKMKINVIAGMSTFFLNKNEIYSETNDIKTYLGSGNNLNNTSFSTNLGIGFDYNLSKHLNFNLEPMFKYQINSFNKDVEGFRPYILGIYTGFSYKF